MNFDDHIEHLVSLKKDCGNGSMAIPKPEGSYYFGDVGYDVHCEKYMAKCMEVFGKEVVIAAYIATTCRKEYE